MPKGALISPGPFCTKSGGGVHAGAFAPRIDGPPRPPPGACGGGPPARCPPPGAAPPCRCGAAGGGPAGAAVCAGAGGTFGFVSAPGHPGGTAGGGAAAPPPRPAPGAGPAANTLHASNVPSLFASRRTTMVVDAGELTNRSPFGAYAIMRGAGSSAYVVTVKPAGTDGSTPAGFGTFWPGFGVPVPGGGNASARG